MLLADVAVKTAQYYSLRQERVTYTLADTVNYAERAIYHTEFPVLIFLTFITSVIELICSHGTSSYSTPILSPSFGSLSLLERRILLYHLLERALTNYFSVTPHFGPMFS